MFSFKNNCLFLFIGLLLLLISCVDKKSSVYNPDEVGKVMPTTPGTVLASRKILISGLKKDTQYWGAAIGGTLAGATTYGLTGGDNELARLAARRCCDARQRRSPEINWYRSPSLRTTIGCRSPWSLRLSAKEVISSESNSVRG